MKGESLHFVLEAVQKHCNILRRKDAVNSLSQKEQVCGEALAGIQVTSAVAMGVGMDSKGIKMGDSTELAGPGLIASKGPG